MADNSPGPQLVPVEGDPFAAGAGQQAQPQLVPVEGNPFAPPPAQMTGLAREAALPASNIAKGAVSILGMPGDALQAAAHLYSKYIGAPLENLVTGGNNAPVWTGNNPYTSQNLLQTTRNLGITDIPSLTPQNLRERLEAAGAQGVGSALPTLGAGALAGTADLGLTSLARTLAGGAGAGVGAQVGSEASRAHPILGALAGGTLGAMAGGGAGTALARLGSAAAGVETPLVGAYRRLGINPTLPGDITGRPFWQQMQAFLQKSPGGAGPIAQKAEEVKQQFGDAIEQTASTLGMARDETAAGQALQNAARTWNNRVFPARQAAAWAPVDTAVAPTAPVDLDNYRQALEDVSGQIAQMPKTAAALQPSRAHTLLSALNSDVPQGQAANWSDVQALRRRLGDALGTPEIVDSLGEQHLKHLYGSLSDDMWLTAARNGAGDAFDNANAVSTNGFAFRGNIINKLIKNSNPSQETIFPDKAARAALNGGDTMLQGIRQEMPGAADELAAFKLRDMADANSGQQNKSGTAISPNTFLTELNRLRQNTPGGFNALYGHPSVSGPVNDLASVADSMKETSRWLNTSGTTHTSQLAHMMTGMAAFGAAGHEAGGIPGMLAGAALPMGGPYIASKAITFGPLARVLATPASPGTARGLAATALRGAYPQIVAPGARQGTQQ